ncbi:MAG: hypothetical protein DWH78_11540 [Planctomycetota bacterium]|nr:MAG: hypothetical protein DWH78_11540 [Planctomycetota bacterium]
MIDFTFRVLTELKAVAEVRCLSINRVRLIDGRFLFSPGIPACCLHGSGRGSGFWIASIVCHVPLLKTSINLALRFRKSSKEGITVPKPTKRSVFK